MFQIWAPEASALFSHVSLKVNLLPVYSNIHPLVSMRTKLQWTMHMKNMLPREAAKGRQSWEDGQLFFGGQDSLMCSQDH